MEKKNDIYRMIPRVDSLMEEPLIREMTEKYGYDCALHGVRSTLEKLRERLGACKSAAEAEKELEDLPEKICRALARWAQPGMTRVVNGTGIILHTGLGRAPLGKSVLQRAAETAGGYSNLEFDLATGKRGERNAHFERLLCQLTGAEAAMAVNNNAGAVLLMLSALAGGREVIVSRGELVEIGGKFRVPDMMELGGSKLREVGTTNRTRLSDYETAVSEETGAFLKVHTSNYRIVGFTESVSVRELAGLKERTGIPLLEDLGSGVLIDLERYGFCHEPSVQETLAQGADVVTFSGDKLLGGPQAGIIAGKREYIEKMKRHPLSRVLRIDKFTASALEAVLLEYLNPKSAAESIPALRMLIMPAETVRRAAEKLAALMREAMCCEGGSTPEAPAAVTVESSAARAGGGSLPMEDIPSFSVAVAPKEISASELERRLRSLSVPVIGRITDGKLLLDLRTVEEGDIPYLAEQFRDGAILRKGGMR